MDTSLKDTQETPEAVFYRRNEVVSAQRRVYQNRKIGKTLLIAFLLFATAFASVRLYAYFSELSLLSDEEMNRLDEYSLGSYPRVTQGDRIKVLVNRGFAVGYSPERKCPLWASFPVRGIKSGNPIKFSRPEMFRIDRRLSDPVDGASTFGAGWDRGHLVAQSILLQQIGPEGMLDAFLMSNICPQSPNLNRSVWSNAERSLMVLAEKRNNLLVITGPIFGDNPEKIVKGNLDVHIPEAFYMIIAEFEKYPFIPRNLNLIAYRFPQDVKRNDDFTDRQKFGVSINQLEEETGLNFFPEYSELHGFWESMEDSVETTHWELD